VRLAHGVDDLIAAPSHVVASGVDDQPHRAEKLGAQTAVAQSEVKKEMIRDAASSEAGRGRGNDRVSAQR
jgi:hypothetical protein